MSAGRIQTLVARGIGRHDLTAVTCLVVAADLSVLIPAVRSSPFRAGFGLVLVLFLPGYAVVAALFPTPTDASGGFGAVERLGFAAGVSVAISICWGLVLSVTAGLHTSSVVGGLSVITVIGVVVALLRDGSRQSRTSDGHHKWLSLPGRPVDSDRLQILRTGTLVLIVVVSLAASGVLLSGAPRPAPTEVYFSGNATTDQPDDGASGFVTGDPQPVPVTIVNHASESRSYTVVYAIQEIEPGTRTRDVPLNVTDERELQRVTQVVPGGESTVVDRSVVPSVSGESLRLVVRVYRDDPAATDSLHTLHVWVSVRSSQRVTSPVEAGRGERR